MFGSITASQTSVQIVVFFYLFFFSSKKEIKSAGTEKYKVFIPCGFSLSEAFKSPQFEK